MKNIVDRFNEKWEKKGKSQCWIWTAGRSCGYGMMRVGGRMELAHRVSYTIHVGAIPEGVLVCHNCPGGDNPLCCNPRHLFLGDNQDNMDDASRKGTTCKKLSPKIVNAIRMDLTHSQVDLAKKYKVRQSTIWKILRGKTHRFVGVD